MEQLKRGDRIAFGVVFGISPFPVIKLSLLRFLYLRTLRSVVGFALDVDFFDYFFLDDTRELEFALQRLFLGLSHQAQYDCTDDDFCGG